SKRVKNQRRSHDALTRPQWSTCSNCGETVLPHRACSHCGFYRGRAVIQTEQS
ncbi:MAG: 50S ribosomal protein L32, partial [Candidatus Binatia bacterium]